MTQTLLNNFTNFVNDRLDDAKDRLELDDGYVNESLKAESYYTQLKSVLTPEQATLLNGFLYSKCTYLAGKRERNAYCAGWADALQLMGFML